MKTKINTAPPSQAYPKLKVNPHSGEAVIFTKENTGTLVHSKITSEIGMQMEDWNEKVFEIPPPGSQVILEND